MNPDETAWVKLSTLRYGSIFRAVSGGRWMMVNSDLIADHNARNCWSYEDGTYKCFNASELCWPIPLGGWVP